MPYWNLRNRPQIKHVPQTQLEIEMPEREINDDIEKFLTEKGWLRQYDTERTPLFKHADFSEGATYYEWHEAVAMEMIRFMRIGVST